MSYQDFKNAIIKVQQCNSYKSRGSVSDDVLMKAEKLLGLNLSKQTREYLKNFGYISIFGHEFFGIYKDDFSGNLHGNMVESTLAERKDYNLPCKWLSLYFFDDGYYGFLDYSDLNFDEEPSVIMASYNGSEYIKVKKIADDFGEFLLKCVQN